MTEFEAAVLLVQLERLEEQTQQREDNATFLDAQFKDMLGLRPLRREPYMTRLSWHGYRLLYEEDRFDGVPAEKFRQALTAEGISAGGGAYTHALYRNPLFTEARFGRIKEFVEFPDYNEVSCPNCERLCRESVTLSQRYLLGTREDMRDIVRAVTKIRENLDELR